MVEIAGSIIKASNIINTNLTTVKLKQGFVFIPYSINDGCLYTDLKDKSESIELTLNSNESNFAYVISRQQLNSESFFEEEKFGDFFDKLDIYLIKMGAKKSPNKHIIEDLGILKLNDKNIELNLKLKKIKKYNA